MALTENTFTADEFKAAIEANADLLPIIKGSLSEKKYVLHDEAEHTSYLKTHEDGIAQRLTKDHAEKLEADVLALTGIPKKSADEKYYDYFKRATGEKLTSVTALQTELDLLKKGHSPSAADKARITELEGAIATKETEYNTKLGEKDTEINNMKVGSVVFAELATIRTKYKAGLPKELVDTYEKQVLADVMKVTKIQEDGKATIVDDKGVIVSDPKTYKPKTPGQELEEKLAVLIDTGKKQTGSGSAADPDPNKPGTFTGVPADVDSRVKLVQYLLSLGIEQGSDEFDKIFAEHGKDLKLK